MQIFCTGISFHSTSVTIRERLGFSARDVERLAVHLRNGLFTHCCELAVLSTCNRVELYGVAADVPLAVRELQACWSEISGVSVCDIEPHSFQHHAEDAVIHLCRVAAGLESLVVGEPQILGQVNQTFQTADQQHMLGVYLRALFRTAIRIGKRARTETDISRNAASISSVAVRLAVKRLGGLENRHIVIVGAGKMGHLALKAMTTSAIGQLSIVNRSRARSLEMAAQFGGAAYGFDALGDVLTSADLVISSTGAPHAVIDADLVRRVMADRSEPLLMIDIAVPRDIEAAVQQIAGATVVDIDGLQAIAADGISGRQQQVPAVEAIMVDELEIFERKTRELSVRPTITDLRHHAESIRQRELGRMLRHLPDVDETTRAQIELFSQSLVKKLLHQPTRRLREKAGQGDAGHYSAAVRHLFDLEEKE